MLRERSCKFYHFVLNDYQFRYIEHIYRKFDIDMKKCENLDQFFEKAKLIGGGMGKATAQLFNEIQSELNTSYDHIQSQQETLEKSFKNYKRLVFKIACLSQIKLMTDGWDFKVGNQDSE